MSLKSSDTPLSLGSDKLNLLLQSEIERGTSNVLLRKKVTPSFRARRKRIICVLIFCINLITRLI